MEIVCIFGVFNETVLCTAQKGFRFVSCLFISRANVADSCLALFIPVVNEIETDRQMFISWLHIKYLNVYSKSPKLFSVGCPAYYYKYCTLFQLTYCNIGIRTFWTQYIFKDGFFNTYRNLCLEYLKILEQNRIRLQTVWRELKI